MLIIRRDAANQITSVSASVKPGIFGGVLISNGHLLMYFFEKDASNQEIVEFKEHFVCFPLNWVMFGYQHPGRT